MKGNDSMEAREKEFLFALGLSVKQLKVMPDFFVRTVKGKVRLTLHSKLEPVLRYADWVSVTVSQKDFINICNNMQKILADLTKKK